MTARHPPVMHARNRSYRPEPHPQNARTALDTERSFIESKDGTSLAASRLTHSPIILTNKAA
jgi:hypothetical protein